MVNITSETESGILTIKINGEVDASSSIFLDEAIAEAVETNSPKLIFDCQNLSYISSAGLGVFMSYLEEFNSRKIKLVLFGLNEKVQNVFEILGLDQLLKIVETEDKARIAIDEI